MGRSRIMVAALLFASACGEPQLYPEFDASQFAISADDIADYLYGFVGAELERAPSDEEKAKILTRWIASASVNDPSLADDLRRDEHRFRKLPFYGLCGERSWVFELLAPRAGLDATILNIYHFGRIGGGHTALHVRYQGAWHYFDPTYAGWFERGGHVLSFEEMVADPGLALAGLHAVPGRDVRFGEHVDNEWRMRIVYSKGSLRGRHSVSDRSSGNTVPLPVRFDAREVPVRIGWPGATREEVHEHGVELGAAERIGVLLNLEMERFAPIFEIENARVGGGYALRFHVASAEGENLVYRLRAENARLERDRLVFESPKPGGVFEIQFIAQAERPRIALAHSLVAGNGITLEGLDFVESDVLR